MQVDLAGAVSDAFDFLLDAGFTLVEASPEVVTYRRGALEADVFWEARSYELGFQIGYADKKYSTSALIGLVDEHLGNEYRDRTAKDRAELAHALALLAGLVRTYGRGALSGDESVFMALERQRQTREHSYALEVRAYQVRPKAREAFRKGNYAEAARLYKTIEAALSPSEVRRMTISQERSRSGDEPVVAVGARRKRAIETALRVLRSWVGR